MFIPHRLYFAKRSSKWENKGVAFITSNKEPDEKYHTVVRLWEITEEQFYDIWEQEGKGFYPKKLYLGIKNDLEIYTITGDWIHEINPPSESYLDIIKRGLRETTGWNDEQIDNYLRKFLELPTREIIRGNLTPMDQR